MKTLINNLINLLYEYKCPVCGLPSSNLLICKMCESSLEKREEVYVKQFDVITVYSWGLYDGKLRDAILSMKSGNKKLCKYFAQIIFELYKNIKNKPDFDLTKCILLPIPSSKKRTRKRGFCQSELIAESLANLLKIKYSNENIIRKKETLFMKKLNLQERRENIKDAFKVIKSFEGIETIIIIDDILTSGSTMCEISKTIKETALNVKLIGLTIAAGDKFDY